MCARWSVARSGGSIGSRIADDDGNPELPFVPIQTLWQLLRDMTGGSRQDVTPVLGGFSGTSRQVAFEQAALVGRNRLAKPREPFGFNGEV